VGKFYSFNPEDEKSAATGSETDDTLWEEKDIANLLKDLSHFDKNNK